MSDGNLGTLELIVEINSNNAVAQAEKNISELAKKVTVSLNSVTQNAFQPLANSAKSSSEAAKLALQSIAPAIKLIQSELNNTAKERIVKLNLDAANVENGLKRIQKDKDTVAKESLLKLKLDATQAENELKRIQKEKDSASKESLLKLKLDATQVENELKRIQKEKDNLDRQEAIKLKLDARQAEKELDRLHDHAKNVSSNIQSVFQGVFQGVGIAITNSIGNAFKGVEGAIGDSVSKYATFQEKINNFATFNGSATTADVKALADEAKRLGQVTSTTGTDAAEAAVQLTKVGLNAKETRDQLEGVVQLSEASGLKDMGVAAQVAGTAFSVMGMQSKDTADLISTVVSNIGGNAQDFLQLFSKAGGEAKVTGQSIETLATAFGILRKNGFEAEAAATALKTTMIRLAAPTSGGKSALKELGIEVYDAQGKMKPLLSMLPEFKTKLAGFNDASKASLVKSIFGNTGAPAFLSLMSQATEKVDELYGKVNNRKGSADTASKKQLEGLPGAQKLLRGSVEGLQLNFAEALSPALEGITRLAVNVVNKLLDNKDMFAALTNGAKEFQSYLQNTPQVAEVLVQTFTQLAKIFSENLGNAAKNLAQYLTANPEAIKNLAMGAVELAVNLGQAAIAAFDFGKGFTEASIQIGAIFQPIADLALSLLGASDGSVSLAENFGKIAAYALVIGGIGSVLGTIVAVASSVAAITTTVVEAAAGVTTWVASVGGLAAIWSSVATAVGLVVTALAPIALTIAGIVAACILVYEAITHWTEITKVVGELWSGLISIMNGIGKAIADTIGKSEIVQTVWKAIVEVVKLLFSPFTTVISYVGSLIQKSEVFKGIWSGLTSIVSNVGNSIKSFCGGALDYVISKAQQFMDALKSITGLDGQGAFQGDATHLSPADASTASSVKLTGAIANQSGITNRYAQAALAGTIQQESGFDPNAKEQGGNGRGLVQWDVRDRAKGVVKMDANGTPVDNQFQEQLLKGINEMVQDYKAATGSNFKEDLNNAKSMNEAMGIFQKTIRFGVSGERDGYANNAYKTLTDGNSATNPVGSSSSSNGGSDAGSKVAQEALSRSGGEFRAGVSAQCANFVRDVLEKAGVKVGTTMAALDGQSTGASLASSFFGKDIGQIIKDKSKVKPGDLLAFGGTYGGYGKDTITHVGISTGNNQMVDRSTSSAPVKNRSIDTFEGKNSGFLYAVRPNAYGSDGTETREEAERRVGMSSGSSSSSKKSSSNKSSTESTDDGDTGELRDLNAESEEKAEEKEADKAAKKAQKTLDIARKGQDKQIAEDRKLAKIQRAEQKQEQLLSVDQLLATTNNPDAKASLENRKKDLSTDNSHDEKIIDYNHQKDDLKLARDRKVQDLKSGVESKVEAAKDSPDYSAAIKNLDVAIGLEHRLLQSTRGVNKAEQDNADSQKTQAQQRLSDASKLQNSYETQKASLEEQKAVAEQTNPVQAKALDIQIQRLDLSYSTNKSLVEETHKLKDLTTERDKYAKILKDSGSKPDATLKNMNVEIATLSNNLTAIKAKSGSNLKIIADKEVLNARELAKQLALINQEKLATIAKTQNDYAKGLSGQLRSNGNTKAADTIDKQIALSEQEVSNKEAILKLDEEIAAKAQTNNAYSSNQVNLMTAQVKALNGINIQNINDKFDTMKQSLKSVKEGLQSSLGDAFKSILDGSKTAGQAFKGLVSSMLSNIASLAANSLMKDLFGGGGSSGGGGIFSSLLGGLFGGNKGGGSSGGGVSSILGGGGGLGGIVSSIFHLSAGGYKGSTIPNYAKGNSIASAMIRERSESGGKNPQLAVVNDQELILTASQTELFFKKGLNKMLGSKIKTFASGNMSEFASSNSSANSTTVNVPVTVNAGSDGSKPKINVTAMQQAIRATVTEELLKNKRNGGLLAN